MQCYLYDLGYLTKEEEEEDEEQSICIPGVLGSALIAGLHSRRYDTQIKPLR